MPGWKTCKIGNNSVVSEWKENFTLSQPTPCILAAFCFSLLRQQTSELSPCVNDWGSKNPFSIKANESEYSKFDESGNIYESEKISSSVNLVLIQLYCSGRHGGEGSGKKTNR